jgi:hypothetical protein
MSFMTKLYLGVGGTVLFIGLFFGLKWQYDNQKRMEGKLEVLTSQLKTRDSALQVRDAAAMASINRLGLRLDTVGSKTTVALANWRATVIRDTIRLPGSTTPTIVFRDTAFRNLPDSVKVDSLVARGERLERGCSLLQSTCQLFRDSATLAFGIKDSIIHVKDSLTKVAFSLGNKPKRHCSPGVSV